MFFPFGWWYPQSIRNHDQGKKHVEIVEEFFRKKREDKLKGAKSESDFKRQMDRIEKVRAVVQQEPLPASSKSMLLFRPPLPCLTCRFHG